MTTTEAFDQSAWPAAGTARAEQAPVFETVTLAGVALARITERGCIGHILAEAEAGRGGWVVTVNLDHLRRLRRDPAYRQLCAQASLRVADGMPLIWASRWQGTALPERVAGSSMVAPLSGEAAKRGLSVFFLGGAPGTAERAAALLQQRYPSLRVAGTFCPPMGFEYDPAHWRQIEQALAAADPAIVFVGLGSPKQELLIERLRPQHPAAWWLGVGVSFSFLCGEVPRAPRWVQRLGLEWVHRLWQEPRRLAKRYLVDGLPFAGWLFAHVLGQRWRGRRWRRPAGGAGSP